MNKYKEFLSNLDYRELSYNLWSKLCEVFQKKKDEKEIKGKKIEFNC